MRLNTRILVPSILLIVLSAHTVAAQTRSATQSRAQAILASFNKKKHVVKERFGVRREKFKEIRSEPAARANPAAYSGTYQVVGDLPFVLRLNVDANGRVTGSGEDPMPNNPGVLRRFTLSNAKIDGSLLTATKLYGSGSTQRLEGVFMNLTTFETPTDKGVTVFGLGVLVSPVEINGVTVDKFFYELKR